MLLKCLSQPWERASSLFYIIKEIKWSQVKIFLQDCVLSATTEVDLQRCAPPESQCHHHRV